MTILNKIRWEIIKKQQTWEIDKALKEDHIAGVVQLVMWIIDNAENDLNETMRTLSENNQKNILETDEKYFTQVSELVQKTYDECLININNVWVIACEEEEWKSLEEKNQIYMILINQYENYLNTSLEEAYTYLQKSNTYYQDFINDIKNKQHESKQIITDKKVSLWLELKTINPINDSIPELNER